MEGFTTRKDEHAPHYIYHELEGDPRRTTIAFYPDCPSAATLILGNGYREVAVTDIKEAEAMVECLQLYLSAQKELEGSA